MMAISDHWPEWVKVIVLTPAAAIGCIFLFWPSKKKMPWPWVTGMLGYLVLVYLIFIR
jgi:uncharacterized membrane protein YjjB (DUF3815 family)